MFIDYSPRMYAVQMLTDLSTAFTHPPTVVMHVYYFILLLYLLNKNKRCRRVVGHGSPGDSRQQLKSCRIIIDASYCGL